MWREGINDDGIKERPDFCAAFSLPLPQALTPLFSPAVSLFSLTNDDKKHEYALGITGNPVESFTSLTYITSFSIIIYISCALVKAVENIYEP